LNNAYNFLGSWQLIPERCKYNIGIPPKSLILRLEERDGLIQLDMNWFTHDDQTLRTNYGFKNNGQPYPFEHSEVADTIEVEFLGSHEMKLIASKDEEIVFETFMMINNKGLLESTQKGKNEKGEDLEKFEIFHRQLAVLPYAHSVSGVAIRPTEQGMIKHKALQAMAEQTDMHLDQIKKQIELLAVQANEIKRRRELSLMIYEAKINIVPQIGQVYHLYEKHNDDFILSLVAPKEWGGGAGPYKKHLGGVKLLADHTWTEVE
jgi:Protein of unknown function (DUF2452)